MKYLFFICLLACRLLHLVFSKECFFCDFTDAVVCPGNLMNCEEDEDCFVGEGAALGVSMIKNKGCTRAINCGKEQPISYMGVTYSLVTNCCQGPLCNAAQSGPTAPSLFLQLILIAVLLLSLLQVN